MEGGGCGRGLHEQRCRRRWWWWRSGRWRRCGRSGACGRDSPWRHGDHVGILHRCWWCHWRWANQSSREVASHNWRIDRVTAGHHTATATDRRHIFQQSRSTIIWRRDEMRLEATAAVDRVVGMMLVIVGRSRGHRVRRTAESRGIINWNLDRVLRRPLSRPQAPTLTSEAPPSANSSTHRATSSATAAADDDDGGDPRLPVAASAAGFAAGSAAVAYDPWPVSCCCHFAAWPIRPSPDPCPSATYCCCWPFRRHCVSWAEVLVRCSRGSTTCHAAPSAAVVCSNRRGKPAGTSHSRSSCPRARDDDHRTRCTCAHWWPCSRTRSNT